MHLNLTLNLWLHHQALRPHFIKIGLEIMRISVK